MSKIFVLVLYLEKMPLWLNICRSVWCWVQMEFNLYLYICIHCICICVFVYLYIWLVCICICIFTLAEHWMECGALGSNGKQSRGVRRLGREPTGGRRLWTFSISLPLNLWQKWFHFKLVFFFVDWEYRFYWVVFSPVKWVGRRVFFSILLFADIFFHPIFDIWLLKIFIEWCFLIGSV